MKNTSHATEWPTTPSDSKLAVTCGIIDARPGSARAGASLRGSAREGDSQTGSLLLRIVRKSTQDPDLAVAVLPAQEQSHCHCQTPRATSMSMTSSRSPLLTGLSRLALMRSRTRWRCCSAFSG